MGWMGLCAFVVPVLTFGTDYGTSNHQWVYTTMLALQLIGAVWLDSAFRGRAALLFIPIAIYEFTILYWHFWLRPPQMDHLFSLAMVVHFAAGAVLLCALWARPVASLLSAGDGSPETIAPTGA